MSHREGDGRRVLITGASSGIGLETALYLAEKGYSVIGTSRSMERLDGLQEQAASRGLAVAAVELDINTDEGVESVMPGLLGEHGGIDVLVNNAGYGLWGPVQSLAIKEVRAQFETNLFATVRLSKAVLPGMVERGRGTIVNISSILGRLGTPFNGAYVASKFALEGLSESMRAELWPLGIRVAVVEPGAFRTNFRANQVIAARAHSGDLPYHSYVQRYTERRSRLGRFWADPVKVARVIHKIARSRRPRFRYPVGPDARLGTLATRLMPEGVFQMLLRRATIG